ncbi:uncharacterized protein [Lolium perenne]|uniref:uncharacterized protein n=1 Tax=Lolium perenne TaxID=4522 RepID=UPI0021F62948|nr:uncharacterized protein LOC127342066 [Lolium perenne]
MSSLPELELSQLPGSSVGEGVERRHQEEEDLGSPAAAAAAPLVPAPDTADMSAPELSQLAGSSSGEGVERQEDSAAAAGGDAVPLASASDTADMSAPELSQLAGSSSGAGVERQEDSPAAAAVPAAPAPDTADTGEIELQEVEREMLEADLIFVPVLNNLFTRALIVPNPMAVRYVYGALFGLMTIVAWTVRDIELPGFDDHYVCDGSHDCIAANGVLRVSMGVAIFFLIMFASTVNTRKLYEFRNFWHSQWWILKATIFLIGYGFATYAPSSLLQFYGTIAHVGAWLFLVIQFLSMTSLIMWVNRWCRVESNRQRWAGMTYGLLPLRAAPVVLYIGSFLRLGFMYYSYAPYCKPTTSIYISVTASVVCLMFIISCVRKVSGGYLAPGMMMAYVVFMCWTTIRSEPHTETCNQKTKPTTDWQNIRSFVIAAVVIITSTYTVGKDYKCIQFSNRIIMLEDDVPYGYGFFHLVFASGAMYIGMLFVGWNAHRTMEKWTVDVGWASTRVRATSGLVVAICYILMLVSQELWNLMLAVTSNSSQARPAGASMVAPAA